MTDDAKRGSEIGRPDPWHTLRSLTAARIGLGRAGGSLPTRPLLEFQLAHARARDAVLHELDAAALAQSLTSPSDDIFQLHSAAGDRAAFIARPDCGRILDDTSRKLLEKRTAAITPYDCAFIVADGLSACAIEHHAAGLLAAIFKKLAGDDWRLAPLSIVRQGRVAIGDEIGALLQARMTVLLIGERPGLSAPDSLGIYLTYDPLPGRSNAERNCISNIREPGGLSYASGAHKLAYLMRESRRRHLSGIDLKEQAAALEDAGSAENA